MEKAKLQKFDYNGIKIGFRKGNDLFVNATEMAKSFGKVPGKWLELPSTKEFIKTLLTIRKSDSFIRTVEGRSGGTWMHEDVALEFARWLSPSFAIWCNDRIKELMNHGFTATPQTLEEMANNPDFIIQLAQNLKKEREQRELAERTIQAQAPKVEYHDKVLQSNSTFNTTTIAKELGTSAKTLNKMLNNLRIMYKNEGSWVLYSKYQDKGFTKTRTAVFFDSEGKERSTISTVWTEKGREFIHKVFNKQLERQVEL